MREKGKTVKDIHFEIWLVCNIQQQISIKVLKIQFKKEICMPQICVCMLDWMSQREILPRLQPLGEHFHNAHGEIIEPLNRKAVSTP